MKCASGSGPFLEQRCAACEHREPYVPSAWFSHVMYLYRLQRGGYPFQPDDLDLPEWLALGEMADLMEIPRIL